MSMSAAAAVRQVVTQITGEYGLKQSNYNQQLNDVAWNILLDLDHERSQGAPYLCDRQNLNQQACCKIADRLRADHKHSLADQLQQLILEWQSASHYVARQDRLEWDEQHSDKSSYSRCKALAVLPLTEHQAMLSLLFALQGTCPPARPVVTTLPALGSRLLQDLAQDAQSAAMSQAGAIAVKHSVQSRDQYILGAKGADLLHGANAADASCMVKHKQQQQQEHFIQDVVSHSWVLPAMSGMQLLQGFQLSPAAASAASDGCDRQHRACAPPQDVLLAAACGADTVKGSHTLVAAMQQHSTPAVKPLLQVFTSCLKQASGADLIGRKLSVGLHDDQSSSLAFSPAKTVEQPSRSLVNQKGPKGLSDGAPKQFVHVVSAAAAQAEAAVKAADGVHSRVAALIELSAAEPGSACNQLQATESGCSVPSSGLSSSAAAGTIRSTAAMPAATLTAAAVDDTQVASDVNKTKFQPVGVPQQDMAVAAAAAASPVLAAVSSKDPAAVEAELVSVSCLAVQGVWSAVQQLWDVLLQGCLSRDGTLSPNRSMGLCRPQVQQELVCQVLHNAELRLRIGAFLMNFRDSPSPTRGDSGTVDLLSSSYDGEVKAQHSRQSQAVRTAFVNAVASVLTHHNASLATVQVNKLRSRQRSQASLIQLVAVQRGMSRQLQQLAQLCWCTVQEYVDLGLYLKGRCDACLRPDETLPSTIGSSSKMLWHVVNLKRSYSSSEQELAAAISALGEAAAAAYEHAVPWPDSSAAAAVSHLGWAPSSWQLKNGFEDSHSLLERLYAGLMQASPEEAPLLGHLFQAAVQPVLHFLRAWAFMPDSQAAEAAADAAAMASFSAGACSTTSEAGSYNMLLTGHSNTSGFPTTLTVDSCAITSSPFAAASNSGHPTLQAAGGAEVAVAGLVCGSGTTVHKSWSGSSAAEAAMRQCLHRAWKSNCQRAPDCPGFLAHVQTASAVSGMQLHLLQLLGGPGQTLADRLGWLAELEVQELQEIVSPHVVDSTGTAGFNQHGLSGAPHAVASRATAVQAEHSATAVLQSTATGACVPQPLRGFMGLLMHNGRLMHDGGSGQGIWLSGASSNVSAQQLAQCADIIADYEAARLAEVHDFLQSLAHHRQAGQAAHELWLASRQQAKQEAEAALTRLKDEAAARRKQRQQKLLAEQKEDIAAAQARWQATRAQEQLHQQQPAMKQQLLQQAAVQGPLQAPQQLLNERSLLTAVHPAQASDCIAAAAAELAHRQPEATADDASRHQELEQEGSACAAAACAGADGEDNGAVVVCDVLLDDAAPPSAIAEGTSRQSLVRSTHRRASAGDVAAHEQQQQQPKQQLPQQRGTWGAPVKDLVPAAGVPSSTNSTAPLAVVGSAAAAAGGTVRAAGQRSNSQPKVLPGMGRPISLSRRSSNHAEDTMQATMDTSGGAGVCGGPAAGKATPQSSRGGPANISNSILGGFAGWGIAQQQHKSKWGMPVMPGRAAGAASTIQRSASVGALLDGHDSNTSDAGAAVWQQQWGVRLSVGGPGGGSGGGGGSSTRPGTPRGVAATGDDSYRCMWEQRQLPPWQHSWHTAQQQQQQQALWPCRAPTAANATTQGTQDTATAAGAAATPTGWLLSRGEMRQQDQGNVVMLSWLLQQAGLSNPVLIADGAANSDAAGAGSASLSLPCAPGTAVLCPTEDPDKSQGPCIPTNSHAQAGSCVIAQVGTGPGRLLSRKKPSAPAQRQVTDVAAAAAAAVPVVASLSVLVVEPLLAQQRLTTQACWGLLLQEHKLLQRLGVIQGLFFQQQGDWVVLLCDALEPYLQQQQQKQYTVAGGSSTTAGHSARGGQLEASGGSSGSSDHVCISPVVLQLLLESAIQQSCLAGVPAAERLSLQVEASRCLAGWSGPGNQPGTSAGQEARFPSSASAAAAAATDCLLLSCNVPWPVSLLLGDVQLQQYADIFSVLLRLRRLQQQLMKQWQPLNSRASRQQVNAGQQQTAATAAEAALGLCRLQDLRRWHAQASHCVNSLLGYMLSELSGQLQVEFEAAVGQRPVDLPLMLEAHDKLLSAAHQVCLLPQTTQQQKSEADQEVSGSAVGLDSLSRLVFALVHCAWQLQQGTAALLVLAREQPGGPGAVVEAPTGFKEGSDCTRLAEALGGGVEELWGSLEVTGRQMEQLVVGLKRRLKSNAATGHFLAGLAARLSV